MSKVYDIAIIGGGILGVSIARELSYKQKNLKVILVEKEAEVAYHTSGRNTGIIHRPFYLNPKTKPIFAKFANESFYFWKDFAKQYNLLWREIGTLEVALDNQQLKHLEKYSTWAKENGMEDNEVLQLDVNEVKKLEPNIRCLSGFLCKTDVSVDFGQFTRTLRDEAEKNSVTFLYNYEIGEIVQGSNCLLIKKVGGYEVISTRFLINCGGGSALKIANKMNLGKDLANLYVRGEYWKVDTAYKDFASRNVYSVPENPNFPFLDPHWIIRADGRVEIGPNAVPVFSPYAYKGFGLKNLLASLIHESTSNKIKLFSNKEFLSLAAREYKSSLMKNEMAKRVQKFMPALNPNWLKKPGTAGVRGMVINPDGSLAKEAIELQDKRSLHILNYNSPGATGAPAYAAYIVKILLQRTNF